jgi:hypothetical protein
VGEVEAAVKNILWLVLLPFAVGFLLLIGGLQLARWKLNHHYVMLLGRL